MQHNRFTHKLEHHCIDNTKVGINAKNKAIHKHHDANIVLDGNVTEAGNFVKGWRLSPDGPGRIWLEPVFNKTID